MQDCVVDTWAIHGPGTQKLLFPAVNLKVYHGRMTSKYLHLPFSFNILDTLSLHRVKTRPCKLIYFQCNQCVYIRHGCIPARRREHPAVVGPLPGRHVQLHWELTEADIAQCPILGAPLRLRMLVTMTLPISLVRNRRETAYLQRRPAGYQWRTQGKTSTGLYVENGN